ncbi:hypothetical protein ACGF07_10385 [Kitasatospora sp. NPDC048194]|uniref:hypothetical protein n=1 Tax=Kitasatospora sp. NPDC048194 TaxID=3364045 RepID=UPI0037209B98
MATTRRAGAYQAWQEALQILVGSVHELEEWQDQRYRFAHRVGELLVSELPDQAELASPVLYGVHLTTTGLAYVGQTEQAGRRLRDLPIGESHHLANTIPPEIWERVVVVQWPSILDSLPQSEKERAAALGPRICGLLLEHQTQLRTQPPLNSRRRHRDGRWRRRQLSDSRSLGAVHADDLPLLQERVREAWDELAAFEAPIGGLPVLATAFGRVVFPSALL